MKFVLAMTLTVLCMNVHARTLHYDEYSVELTDTKYTSPALHILIDENELVFGAMYELPAPEHTIHIEDNGTEYWVGPWCMAGTYLPPKSMECSDCGYGYYCSGGVARDVCLSGIIGCNTKTKSADVTVDESLLNRILTPDEVAQYIPVTDISDWEMVDQGISKGSLTGNMLPEAANNPEYGQTGTIGPGTYLFSIHPSLSVDNKGACHGDLHSTFFAIFNKPVSYKLLSAINSLYIFLDTEHPEFTSYNVWLPADFVTSDTYCSDGPYYCCEVKWTNVTNVDNIGRQIYIYKLK